MRTNLNITDQDVVHVCMRTWARPIADGYFGDMVPTPTVFIHVGGIADSSLRQADGYGPRVVCEDAAIDVDLARAIDLRDQLTAVIAEHEHAEAGQHAAGS